MRVEWDIFSGRPNPSWLLSVEECTELLRLFKNIPLADKGIQEYGLGYHGFTLLNPERTGGLSPRIRVYRGIITMEDKNEKINLYKDIHKIEHWLLQYASQHGYKTIVDSIVLG